MNIRPGLLKTFLAVARCRNITRAAAEIHLAQSSVSDQLQLLENDLGTRLFTRSRTSLELTAAGAVMQRYAEEILALLDEARAAVQTAADQPARRLTIGTLETIASTTMPGWLAAFQGAHPDVSVQMKIAGSGTLMQLLASGGIDIACCFERGALDELLLQTITVIGTAGADRGARQAAVRARSGCTGGTAFRGD
ncbi:hypothetical protein GCM10007860_28030 [Chitiniphilus shinanonensis]|uniref:HTH lysR-type domain-containing protein n=1 Tax=Chitiniphilus shinanonensis TaxID=553088 RepID=A0ABQ6BV78_9NEIS|nr:LysR family transcriptional regulator [Chitiniphilus shinanonensis]GLS05646.1 hypothetical protein GCM10007860_28030 [Chitiniphilus shinanonensis]